VRKPSKQRCPPAEWEVEHNTHKCRAILIHQEDTQYYLVYDLTYPAKGTRVSREEPQ
jgi:hypothetical protein